MLLALLYTNQSMCVRWKNCISDNFSCTNGIKQGGVLSPTLFCIYFDELLIRLKHCGSGCHLGHLFTGALSYADDVALLAPTLTAAKVMLNVCEQFANNFNVLFNADKSALLVCGRSIRKEVNLRLNGRIIQQNSTAVHLGTTIGDNSSTRNVKKAASDLYCLTNVLMCKFGHCSIDVLSALFFSYCSSFYGCPLWDLRNIEPILTAWRKCLKRIWKLNIRTRTKYINNLPKGNLISALLIHSLSFYMQCLSSSNAIVKLASNYCFYGCMYSVISENVHLCSVLSSVPLRFIFDDFENVKSIIQRGMYDEATIAESLALKDLCYLRDGLMFLNFEITSEELLCAFNHFTI
jgi:hypothetical protein